MTPQRELWRAAAIFAAAIGAGALAAAEPLEAYAWRARPLVIFAPQADDADLVRQLALLEGSEAERRERETPLILVVGDDATVDGRGSSLDAAALRARYGAPADAFALRLVGKDGGVKLARDAPTPAAEIFALIDAMPMRRREMEAP